MAKCICLIIMIGAMVVESGCGNVVNQRAPSTSLPPGVFSGTNTCDLRITSPSGEQIVEENTQTVTFEINDRGVPIVEGAEIRVGRSVGLQGLQATYTRIQATGDGVVIHSDVSGSVNGVSFTGTAIATMAATTGGGIEYDSTQNWTDSNGFAYNSGCVFLLSP